MSLNDTDLTDLTERAEKAPDLLSGELHMSNPKKYNTSPLFMSGQGHEQVKRPVVVETMTVHQKGKIPNGKAFQG